MVVFPEMVGLETLFSHSKFFGKYALAEHTMRSCRIDFFFTHPAPTNSLDWAGRNHLIMWIEVQRNATMVRFVRPISPLLAIRFRRKFVRLVLHERVNLVWRLRIFRLLADDIEKVFQGRFASI
jgi:hypothetical protein